MRLEFNHYGKHAVRLLLVRRGEITHEIAEWRVDVLLEGDLAGSYLGDDNSSIVPTDTIKNIVQLLAYDHSTATRDRFAAIIARHFLEKYSHIAACDVDVMEKKWDRLMANGFSHPHTFVRNANGSPFSKVRLERSGNLKRSGGISGIAILKTTESGFSGFNKCEFTTLQETTDRILSTVLDSEWEYSGETGDIADEMRMILLDTFARNYSPSLQRTLYQTGEAAIHAFPEISRIRLAMPNKHYLNIDLEKFGRSPAQNTVFLPIDEPHGFIEAVVSR